VILVSGVFVLERQRERGGVLRNILGEWGVSTRLIHY
jgi:hypothetical protein